MDSNFQRALTKSGIAEKEAFINDPFSALNAMEITAETVKHIEESQYVYKKLFIQSHMSLFCSDAGVGKTTIMNFCCAEMVKNGYKVLYINVDASATDMKFYQRHAEQYGYKLFNPDLVGKSNQDIINWLINVGDGEATFFKTIVVLDTLKKFCDVMDKRVIKEFNKILRKCTLKGMTIVCCAHTNKFKDSDGNPIYEGTADLRNDFDELLYLTKEINPDGSSNVLCSAEKGKSRGVIEDTSFHITREREVLLNKDYKKPLLTVLNFPMKEPKVRSWTDEL
jgi:hypothetical protein